MRMLTVEVAGVNGLQGGRKSLSAGGIYSVPSEPLPSLGANSLSLRVHGLVLCCYVVVAHIALMSK
jgi:hypothetical protein